MKEHFIEFFRRGATACGLGPLVLAILYLILNQQGIYETLTVQEVCLGIISLTILAFIAGGMNFIYRIEQIPLLIAVTIHGAVLYITYLATYLINGWLELGSTPVVIFSLIFIVGYLAIWAIIYAITKKSTNKLNEILKQKQNQH